MKTMKKIKTKYGLITTAIAILHWAYYGMTILMVIITQKHGFLERKSMETLR